MSILDTLRPTRRSDDRGLRGPRGHILLGSLAEYRDDPLGFFLRTARTYGDLIPIRFVYRTTFFLNHPDHVKHVLQDNQKKYDRETVGNSVIRLFVNDSLLTMDGQPWLQRRRLMQPAFHKQRLASFVDTMAGEASHLVERWTPWAERGRPMNVMEEMMRITLAIAGLTMFHVDLSDEASELGRAFTDGQEYFTYRMRSLLPMPLWLPTPLNRRFRANKETIDALVYQLIEERRSGSSKDDLLQMLLEARDVETGEALNDQELRNEVVTMLTAGHETTAVALTWIFYLLAHHPEVLDKLREEVNTVLGVEGVTAETIPALRYTRMVIEEAMRLYPPAWAFSRRSIEEDEIGGHAIPANTNVIMSPYVMHRHPDYWPEPDRFEPERFAPGKEQERPRFAYFPFGGGPHLCIGNQFAMTEATILLAAITQRFRLELLPEQQIRPEPLITLRPNRPVHMVARPWDS